MTVSLIIPMHNERENVLRYPRNLFPVIAEIEARFKTEFEYVFIDDGSTDDTHNQIVSITKNTPRVLIYSYPSNQGMGYAIQRGIGISHGDLIITMDADLTFRPADIHKLLKKYYETQADCVSGSSYAYPGLMDEITPYRLFLSRCVNWILCSLLSTELTSVSQIFRLYKRFALDEFTITSNNFEINAEIMAKMVMIGKNVVEIPAMLTRRKHGMSKANLRKAVKNYLVLFYRIFRTKYLGGEWK
jgi:dolichol-phosphate mannosyltransferase